MVLFQTIQFSISTQFSSIWPIERTLSGASTPGQNRPEIISQSSCITGTSPSNYLVSYTGHSLRESYPSVEKLLVYSTAPAKWANVSISVYTNTYVYVCTFVDIRGVYDNFPDFFFVWALLLIVHSWNSSPLRSNHLRLQCTCCTVPTTSGRPHGSPLVWACQWLSSQPLSSPQLSHNDSPWAYGITKTQWEQGLDYREAEELSWCPSWSNSLWQGWGCEPFYCPGENSQTRFEECWTLPTESLPELP